MVFEPGAVVAGDAILDLASEAFHAGKEFFLCPLVPLLLGRPLVARETAFGQEFGLMEVLGSRHEGGVFEVFLPRPVDARGGFLPQLVNVGFVYAVLADEEQALLYCAVCGFQRFRGLCVVRPLKRLCQFEVGKIFHGHLMPFHFRCEFRGLGT